ncbi:MAG: hypothetical protein KAI17_05355, partial [Thiotrichaceae bacterium]|nr:hypothetical protein [Thiotrichaceae bacterium]
IPSILSADDYALHEFIKAGWSRDAANAVVAVNKAWFNSLKQEHPNDFYQQINLLKKLKPSSIISRFVRLHPETAGLVAVSENPILLIKILKKPACYNALTSFFALHASHTEIQLLTQALEKHRDLMCKLALRGISNSETVFIFSRNTQGAREYDAWLERVFDKYLRHSNKQLAEIVFFMIKNGPDIRKRLDKENYFYKHFRKTLWPALERVVDKNGAFEWLANDPYIWDLLALKDGERLLNKWGLGPISLLFGEGSLQPIIIEILLEGDDNTVEALFRYKNEPLFRNLMRRPLSANTQAALANKLLKICPNYPEQACPGLPHHLRYFASITDDVALAEEVGILPAGPITWIPFHGSYYAIKKMTEGRDITGEDLLNMGLDALSFIPSALFAKPFSGVAHPLKKGVVFKVSAVGLSFTPYRYHLVKPLGKFAIRTGSRTHQILASEPIQLPSKQRDNFMTFGQKVIKPIEKHSVCQILVEFKTSVFMRKDTKVVMKPSRGLSSHFFQETAEKALSIHTKQEKLAWQQNISAWWLMNAAVAP